MLLILFLGSKFMNNKVSKNYVRCILFLNKNSGFPKYRKIYGNGAVVLGLQTEGYQQFYSSPQRGGSW